MLSCAMGRQGLSSSWGSLWPVLPVSKLAQSDKSDLLYFVWTGLIRAFTYYNHSIWGYRFRQSVCCTEYTMAAQGMLRDVKEKTIKQSRGAPGGSPAI